MIATNDIVFIAKNAHCADSGTPPALVKEADSDAYVGYFENEHGEQWLVEIDRQNKSGTLRGGDIGWERQIEIVDGQVDPDLIIGRDEFNWLTACWSAATGDELKATNI